MPLLLRSPSYQGFSPRNWVGSPIPSALFIHNNDIYLSDPDKPNQKWLADITYVNTVEGWWHLTLVLDLFARRIAGWAMAEYMCAELVEDALLMALGRRLPTPGGIQRSVFLPFK
jgi:hypothetical protein